MAKFHLDKSGNPAPCSATQRACPLGGEHYDSMKDAMFASAQEARREAFNADSRMQAKAALIEQWKQEDGEGVAADAVYDQWAEIELRNRAKVTTDIIDDFDDPFWDDYEDPFADPLEDLASQNEWRMDDDVDDEDFDDFVALQEAYSGLPDDPEGQDDFARSKLRESIAENKEFFNSSAPELVIYAIDDRVSKQVAAVFDNPSGRKKLMELVTHLETTLSKDKFAAQQAGTYVAHEWAQQESQLTAMKHLLSPRSGHRRSTGSTKRDIDPELIQALRFMYLKKYGVDPFEAGVSVSELLAMLKSGELR